MNTTNAIVSTKPAQGEAPIKTNATINWDECTPEDIRALAQQALIVKLQGKWRKEGIPAEATVNVKDHKVGARAPKKTLLESVATMTNEEKAALLAMLQS